MTLYKLKIKLLKSYFMNKFVGWFATNIQVTFLLLSDYCRKYSKLNFQRYQHET